MQNMKQDLFRCLPDEIIIDIMSRLPAQTVLRCKCVCKTLHYLIETHEFAELHLSKSVVSGLAATIYPEYILDKTIRLTNVLIPEIHLSTITTLHLGYYTTIMGSADGLLLLSSKLNCGSKDLYLCNPITREHINLHSHTRLQSGYPGRVISYGFGVSKISGQYKAVRICVESQACKYECNVYTIGTRSWRSIAPQAYKYRNEKAIFVNGNLHWFVRDLLKGYTPLISCFDLETELFTTFSPPSHIPNRRSAGIVLAAAEDSLCLCDYTSSHVVIIWLMKEYGVEKSWTKEFVITDNRASFFNPVRVSKDGVIMMFSSCNSLMYYSSKNNTIQTICNPQGHLYVSSLPHIPSFLSLKCFSMEDSFSF